MEERKDEEIPAPTLDLAEEYIEHGNHYAAQNVLDKIDEDSGRKHYLQSKVYQKECWYNEQRKELKKAVKAEPDNEIYRKELDGLLKFSKTDEYKETLQRPTKAHMGGVEDICSAACWGMSC